MSISNYAENKLLDAIGGTAFSVTNAYLQLHTGDPGEDGTANVASNTTRQAVSFSSAAGGSMDSSATVEWTNVSNTETYTHWSMWDSSTSAGSNNHLWYGALASSASVVAGDTFQITLLTLTLD